MSAGIYTAELSEPRVEAQLAEVLPTVSAVGAASYQIARGCLYFYVFGAGISVLIVALSEGPASTIDRTILGLIGLGFVGCSLLNCVGFTLGFAGLFCQCERKRRTVWAMVLNSLGPSTLLLILAVVVVPRLASGAAAPERKSARPAGAVSLEAIYTTVPSETDGWFETLYRDRNYAAVETHIESLLEGPFDPMRSRGLSSLYRTLAGLDSGFPETLMEDVLDEWVATRPDAHAALLVRGQFRIKQAWRIRGCEYAHKVPADAWPKFQAKIGEAEADLELARRLGPHDANAAAALITVAMASNQERAVMERYYLAALEASPSHMDARSRKINYLMPKWHGSFDELFAFAEELRRDGQDHPEIWYQVTDVHDELARLYRESGRGNYYAKDEVWNEIELICRSYIERYPERLVMRSTLAYYANKAGRTDVELEQYEIIGDRWLPSLWGSLEKYNAARATALWYGSQQHIQDGNYVEAERMVQQSLLLEPRSFEARILLARIYMEGRHDLAAAQAQVSAAASLAKTTQQRQELKFAKSIVNLP